MTLEGQKIVVVGGGSGIGLATTEAALSAGAEVFIAGRSEDRLRAAAERLSGRIETGVLDFTNGASVEAFFAGLDRMDHLVLAGAGATAWGEFAELAEEDLRRAFEGKFWGHFRCAKRALPLLEAARGSIVFVIGGSARSAIPGTAGVAAVNGAILAMARTLAKELGPLGVRVNVLSPGLVDTPAYDWMGEDEKEAFFDRMGAGVPVGRVGRPEEIAQALLPLLENGFATGAVFDVDGGGRL